MQKRQAAQCSQSRRTQTDKNLENGAGDRTRTYYPIITNDVLYLMSYTGLPVRLIALWPLVEKTYFSSTRSASMTSASMVSSVVSSV